MVYFHCGRIDCGWKRKIDAFYRHPLGYDANAWLYSQSEGRHSSAGARSFWVEIDDTLISVQVLYHEKLHLFTTYSECSNYCALAKFMMNQILLSVQNVGVFQPKSPACRGGSNCKRYIETAYLLAESLNELAFVRPSSFIHWFLHMLPTDSMRYYFNSHCIELIILSSEQHKMQHACMW